MLVRNDDFYRDMPSQSGFGADFVGALGDNRKVMLDLDFGWIVDGDDLESTLDLCDGNILTSGHEDFCGTRPKVIHVDFGQVTPIGISDVGHMKVGDTWKAKK